jgi:hypothetical protein
VVPGKTGKGQWHHRGRQRRQRGQRDPADLRLGHRPHPHRRFFHLVAHVTRLVDKNPPGLGQLHRPGGAVEQPGRQHRLQAHHGAGNRRLRKVHSLRGLPKTEGLGHAQENLEFVRGPIDIHGLSVYRKSHLDLAIASP